MKDINNNNNLNSEKREAKKRPLFFSRHPPPFRCKLHPAQATNTMRIVQCAPIQSTHLRLLSIERISQFLNFRLHLLNLRIFLHKYSLHFILSMTLLTRRAHFLLLLIHHLALISSANACSWLRWFADPKRNEAKAALLYSEIDNNPLFQGTAATEDRSSMNVTFVLTDSSKAEEFDKMWNEANISGIKGHRDVGGYRASMYNALPIESVEVLVNVMKQLALQKA